MIEVDVVRLGIVNTTLVIRDGAALPHVAVLVVPNTYLVRGMPPARTETIMQA